MYTGRPERSAFASFFTIPLFTNLVFSIFCIIPPLQNILQGHDTDPDIPYIYINYQLNIPLPAALSDSEFLVLNAIDLSTLGLDRIEEDESGFRIGCMATLRDIEMHEGLNKEFQNLFKEAVRHIVGCSLEIVRQ